MEEVEFKLFISFMLLFLSIAIILNTLTMVMIVASRVLRKKHNVFTFNLALSDCASSVVIMIEIVSHYREIEFDGWWIQPTFTSALIMSVLTTLAIAVYRYIVFRFDPYGNRNLMSALVCTIICIVGWVIVLSVYILVSRFVGYETIGLVASPIIILSSLMITAICYIVIYRTIVVTPHQDGLKNNDPIAQNVKKTTSILTTFAIIVFTNFACWVIICCILLMEFYAPEYYFDQKWFVVLADIAFNLVCVNAVLNPIIYWTRLTDFKRHFTVCCPGRCGTQDPDWPVTADSQAKLEMAQSKAQAEDNKV